MSTIVTPRRAILAALFATSALAAVACGSSNGNPMPGTGGMSTIVGPTSTSSSSSSGSPASSGSTSTSTSSTSSSSGTGGCYSGMPTTNDEFLNACNGATCNTFDPKRIPLWDGGALPPLP